MSRREFTAETKRQAWKRSGEVCEGNGSMYGLPAGMRCTRDLNRGVQYDHDDPDVNSKDNSLENCVCLCPPCHLYKTTKRDRPLIAKTNHQSDMRRGIDKPFKQHMPGSKASGWKKPMNGPAVRRT